MREIDPFKPLFDSLPELRAPSGFERALYARLSEASPAAERNGALRLSGIVCIASALAMFLVLRLPLANWLPQALNALKGVLP